MALHIRKNIAYRRIADELFIVDGAASRLHRLNGTAALIWDGLARGKSESRILAELGEEFEVGPKEAAGDLKAFLEELSRTGLLDGN